MSGTVQCYYVIQKQKPINNQNTWHHSWPKKNTDLVTTINGKQWRYYSRQLPLLITLSSPYGFLLFYSTRLTMQSRRYDAGYPTFEHSSLILPTQSTTLKRDHLPAWIKVEQILELFKAHRRGNFPWNSRNGPLSKEVSESELSLSCLNSMMILSWKNTSLTRLGRSPSPINFIHVVSGRFKLLFVSNSRTW